MAVLTKRVDACIKEVMLARNTVALTAYRAIKAKVMVEMNKIGGTSLSEDELFLGAVRKEIREREESNSFIPDKTHAAVKENLSIIEVLARHVPQQLSSEQIRELVLRFIAESGAQSPRDLGKIMALLGPHKGTLDMALASKIAKDELLKPVS